MDGGSRETPVVIDRDSLRSEPDTGTRGGERVACKHLVLGFFWDKIGWCG